MGVRKKGFNLCLKNVEKLREMLSLNPQDVIADLRIDASLPVNLTSFDLKRLSTPRQNWR